MVTLAIHIVENPLYIQTKQQELRNFMPTVAKFLIALALTTGTFVQMLSAQAAACVTPDVENGICSNNVKNSCVSSCTQECADVGVCIFGCEIGGINNEDTCSSSCSGLGESCLNSCFSTVRCIHMGCRTNVTSDVSLNLGAVGLNRATGKWQQTIRITNISGKALTNLGFALDELAAGWTVTNNDGVTSDCGSGYKNFGDLADGATATVTIQLSRVGTPLYTYSPRVITGPTR